MTKDREYQIELSVERSMDRLDARLMAGRIGQEEYDAEVEALNKWAEEQYGLSV